MEHIYTELQTPTQDMYSGISPGVKEPGRHTDQASAMASHVTVTVTQSSPLNSAGQAAPGTEARQLPGSMQTFLRGQPKALGYIISGSLAVAAENTRRRGLVKACLGMNVVSSVFAGFGIILYSISVSILSFDISPRYNQLLIDVHYLNSINMTFGIVAVLLVLNILEMCIAIATSAFGCKSECCYTAMPEVAFQQA
ncbi:membrane-spanning 4-domains subfamily A member 4A-like isoform X2 [Acipenser ruthenus]|uniref:membrane-spanning 4-domains subfamily A member 4A-like isoform X2 n=1 Tax=Acipenser ruthenus TaxID=7906 RepID=UPI002742507A|nr:membrane-spanning 4-domains subfamily A member 4A-like isoform X2 [Acipenser ruthenus]